MQGCFQNVLRIQAISAILCVKGGAERAGSLLFNEPFSFVWDEDKNQINIKKHGIDFKTAALVFNDDLRLEYPDPEHSETEARYRTIGLVHDVLTVVYCDRENAETGNIDIRIISARLATRLERNAYNNNIIGRF